MFRSQYWIFLQTLEDISRKRMYSISGVQMEETVKVVRLVLAIFFAGILFNIPASAASEPLDASQQLFFNQFRYAVQAHDTSRILRLTHPKSQECVPEEDREFYYGKMLDGLVSMLGKRQTMHKVRVTGFVPDETDVSKDNSSGEKVNWLFAPEVSKDYTPSENIYWPVDPEVRIIMEYEQHGREAVVSLYLARDNNEWKWVHICTK